MNDKQFEFTDADAAAFNEAMQQALSDMAETQKERGATYKESPLKIGHVLKALFPIGVNLISAECMNKYHLLIMIVSKLIRLCNTGLSHEDSARDLGVYACMLLVMIKRSKAK
jgi:hypothetical protein